MNLKLTLFDASRLHLFFYSRHCRYRQRSHWRSHSVSLRSAFFEFLEWIFFTKCAASFTCDHLTISTPPPSPPCHCRLCRAHGGFFSSRLAVLDRSTAVMIAPKLCTKQVSSVPLKCTLDDLTGNITLHHTVVYGQRGDPVSRPDEQVISRANEVCIVGCTCNLDAEQPEFTFNL